MNSRREHQRQQQAESLKTRQENFFAAQTFAAFQQVAEQRFVGSMLLLLVSVDQQQMWLIKEKVQF